MYKIKENISIFLNNIKNIFDLNKKIIEKKKIIVNIDKDIKKLLSENTKILKKKFLLEKDIDNIIKYKRVQKEKIYKEIRQNKIDNNLIKEIKGYEITTIKKRIFPFSLFDKKKPDNSEIFYIKDDRLSIIQPTIDENNYFETFKSELYSKMYQNNNVTNITHETKKIYWAYSGVPFSPNLIFNNDNILFDSKTAYNIHNKITNYKLTNTDLSDNGIFGKKGFKIILIIGVILFILYKLGVFGSNISIEGI